MILMYVIQNKQVEVEVAIIILSTSSQYIYIRKIIELIVVALQTGDINTNI